MVLSLPQILHEAQRHPVTEIAIEPGQPVTFHGERGALVLGESLDEGEISDALTRVLAPEQMAELAVASMVEFHVDGYAEWDLIAETGEEGVMIRGRIREGAMAEEYGAPLDLPPLPHRDELTSEIPRALVATARHQPGETHWDINAVEGAVMQPIPPTGSGAIEDPTLVPPPEERIAVTVGVGHESNDDATVVLENSEGGFIDFALVGRTAPTVDTPRASPNPALKATAPNLRRVEFRGTRPTMRGDDTLAMHIDSLTPGTVVYLAGVGAGARLLEHFEAGYEVVDDSTWADITTRPLSEIPMGQAYLVRLEDPSRCLPWLLRRLEEGACVVVETRCRTAAGARRVMLGAEATPQLCAWLDAHRQLWLHADGTAWLLDRL